MTWLESWEGSYNGDWLGSQEPEPTGSMRATLRGSATVGAALTTGVDEVNPFGIYGNSKQRKIQLDDDMVIKIVLQCAVHTL